MFPDILPNPRPATLRRPAMLATVVIDTEEDFDWTDPVEGTAMSTSYLTQLADLQPVLLAHGAVPTYLVTYAVLENAEAVRLLARYRDRGEAMLGIQLHPWVTPPFAGGGTALSFGGNLAPGLEARKLDTLIERFVNSFGVRPEVFRAGRYGLGRHTAALIERAGITVDTSVAPRTSMLDEGGPDYLDVDYRPFWFGRERTLLELPLGRAIVGWGGEVGSRLYRHFTRSQPRQPIAAMLARLGCAERVTLSPEGNDRAAAIRLVRGLVARGQTILPLSFHSSSIAPGRNPYVKTRADLHRFYDELSAMLCCLADQFGARFVTAPEIPAHLTPAAG